MIGTYFISWNKYDQNFKKTIFIYSYCSTALESIFLKYKRIHGKLFPSIIAKLWSDKNISKIYLDVLLCKNKTRHIPESTIQIFDLKGCRKLNIVTLVLDLAYPIVPYQKNI